MSPALALHCPPRPYGTGATQVKDSRRPLTSGLPPHPMLR